MRSFLRRILVWIAAAEAGANGKETVKLRIPGETPGMYTPPTVRLGVHDAMNGRVLEVQTYTPNPHGPDWKSEFFLVPEGENLSEAVTMLLIAKNIK
jgi:hypothetical protein